MSGFMVFILNILRNYLQKSFEICFAKSFVMRSKVHKKEQNYHKFSVKCTKKRLTKSLFMLILAIESNVKLFCLQENYIRRKKL